MIKAHQIGLKETELQKIVSVLSNKKYIREVILFGSRAKSNFHNGSDIDIALKGVIEHKAFLDILIEIENLDLPYKFDIVLFEKIDNPDFIDHINRVGIELYRTNK